MQTVTPSQFKQIAETAKKLWGLDLTEKKLHLVSSRLQRFLRNSEHEDVDAYLRHLKSKATDADRLAFFDLLSTNVTSFFRERAAFDYLERELWTPLSRGNLTLPGKKVRIWSAACSTGPEPYTLAMHAMEHLKPFKDWDVSILATDLATSALEKAKAAVYPESMMTPIGPGLVGKYFEDAGQPGHKRVRKAVRDLVEFKQVNLMDRWTHRGPFDVIFLRNCMIYFDQETRAGLVRKVSEMLRPGGIFVIGSSETLSGLDSDFRPAQPAVYVK